MDQPCKHDWPIPSTPLGATSEDDRSRQPRPPCFATALSDPLTKAATQQTRNRRPRDWTRPGMPGRASTRHKDAYSKSRSATPQYSRRRAEACRRLALTRGGRAAKRRPKPHLTTPQLDARAAETTREPEPSHALERFGEPERSAEMTAGAALVARHLRVDEQPAEVTAVSRSPLHGGDHGGLRPRRANPTGHETPPLPRVCVGQLVANDLPSGATHAAPASTAQHLERLQAAGSSPQ